MAQPELFDAIDLGVSPRLIEQREQREKHRAEYLARLIYRPASRPTIVLDGEQQQALAQIEAFIGNAEPGDYFVLHGLAGTGKTSVLAHVAQERPGAALCCPTGKAATVLARKTGIPCATLHSLLYVPDEQPDGRLAWIKRCAPGEMAGMLVLVDEASMVNATLAADLLETGAVVIAAGDPGQLPPVEGVAFFDAADFTLIEIRRQAADSPIIRQAHRMRQGLAYHGDGDAFRIIRERSDENYDWADIVLCWRNETRHKINRFLRARRGIHPDAPPRAGEPVICLKNAHGLGIMNGEAFVLAEEFDPAVSVVQLVDGPRIERAWFEPHHGAREPPRGRIGFGLAYAITVHKAQGSEWPRVLIIDEFAYAGAERPRWKYTATTRASEAVRIVPSRRGD
jgi:exodeoxyribonuclease V